MEANFDVATNRAAKWISNPVLCTVLRPRRSSMVITNYREEIRTCLTQVCVIRDEEISVLYGVMSIGGVEMWSRETAWVAMQHREASPSVKRKWGQFFYGTPIFRLWSPDSTEFSYEAFFREWRHEDAQSILLMQHEIKRAFEQQVVLTGCELTSRVRPARFSTDIGGCIDTSSDLLYHKNVCDRAMDLWLEHLGSLATDRWPLLSHASNYEFLKSKEWRCRQLAPSRLLQLSRKKADRTGEAVWMIAQQRNGHSHVVVADTEFKRHLDDVPNGQAVRILDVVGDYYLMECDSPKCKGLANIHNFVLLEPFLEEARTDHTREAEWMIARQKDGHFHCGRQRHRIQGRAPARPQRPACANCRRARGFLPG